MVIGAGFIGAEVASTATKLGLDVTVVEAALAPLAGPLGVQLGAAVARLHAEHGTRLLCGAPVAGLTGGDRVTGVRLADGRQLPADVVVVGIGAVPNVEWLRGSRSNWPTVWCVTRAGQRRSRTWLRSATVRPGMSRVGRPHRVEHWTGALERPAIAVATLLAGRAPQRHAGQTSVLLVRPVRLQDPVRRHRRSRRRDHLRGRQPARCQLPAVYRREGQPVAVLGVTSRGCSPAGVANWAPSRRHPDPKYRSPNTEGDPL